MKHREKNIYVGNIILYYICTYIYICKFFNDTCAIDEYQKIKVYKCKVIFNVIYFMISEILERNREVPLHKTMLIGNLRSCLPSVTITTYVLIDIKR